MDLVGTIYCNKYRVTKLIGEGSFGKVFIAKNLENSQEVAIKLVKYLNLQEKLGRKRSQLSSEEKTYNQLKDNEGIPTLYQSFTEGEYNGIAIELLGPNLGTISELCGGHLELPTILVLAEQMISRLEVFHAKGLLHRDIKPENFALGKGEKSMVAYIIDYGLAKRYREPKSKAHIPFKQNKKLTGTARYSSINTHMGYEQSRRDDLECLGYTLVFLAKGELPWQNVHADNKKEKYKKIMDLKNSIPIETLCKGMNSEFVKYIYYCRSLKFEDTPDYDQFRNMFKDSFYRSKYDKGFSFTWIRLGVNLSMYKKPKNTLGIGQPDGNLSSNRAECEEGCESGIIKVQNRHIDKDIYSGKIIIKRALMVDNINNSKQNQIEEPILDAKLLKEKEFLKEKEANRLEMKKNTRKSDIEKLMKNMPKELPKVLNKVQTKYDFALKAEKRNEQKKKKNEKKEQEAKAVKKDNENYEESKKEICNSKQTYGNCLKEEQKVISINNEEKKLNVIMQDSARKFSNNKFVLDGMENHRNPEQSSCDLQLVDIVENKEIYGNLSHSNR